MLPPSGLPSGVSPAMLGRLAERIVTVARREANVVQAPYTLEPLGTIPLGQPADVEEAVRRARIAQPAWAAVPPRRRARFLLRFHDLLLERREQVLDLIQLESGKARAHALEEVLDTALVARHYGLHGPRYLRPERHRASLPIITHVVELHHPVGVVGVIAPWNFPLILSITDVLAAVMAGNAVVLRPDLQSSFTALWAADLLSDCGLPDDVLTVVTGDGAVLGPSLIDGIDFLMFTGSTRTGRVVAEHAARRLIGCSLELGGKNPMLVLGDADIDKAVDGAVRGSFVGAGQVCVSIERLYVDRRIFDRFVTAFVERTQRLTLAGVASMTTARQIEIVDRHVRDAVDKGATLLAGGRRRPEIGPLFYEPTVLAGVAPGMLAFADETFGPVVSVYSFESDDDAVAQANASCYGLNASVWSRDLRRARAVASRLRTGTVNVNEAYAATWVSTASPIGGMKESGIGRRHGREGILKYTEAQTIATQRLLPLAPLSFLRGTAYEHTMTRLLKVLRQVPGMR
jgi:succinate-semialdehyde dehydrogenase/glutarate-semialdehyde dehydrogenase